MLVNEGNSALAEGKLIGKRHKRREMRAGMLTVDIVIWMDVSARWGFGDGTLELLSAVYIMCTDPLCKCLHLFDELPQTWSVPPVHPNSSASSICRL